jgi:hypothetical protein
MSRAIQTIATTAMMSQWFDCVTIVDPFLGPLLTQIDARGCKRVVLLLNNIRINRRCGHDVDFKSNTNEINAPASRFT